jgi:hypothetical protein
MARFPKGLTLTPEERAQAAPTASDATKSHTCTVTLPNGAACKVTYTRYNRQSHQFEFGTPLSTRLWANEPITGGIPEIEAQVAALSDQAFQKAQEAEQKAARRKPGAAGRTPYKPDNGPQMDAKVADRFAGQYAPCVKNRSGRLIRIGSVYDRPEGAARELRDGRHSNIRLVNGQQFVVGICNRAMLRWEDPTFLAIPQETLSAPEADAALQQSQEEAAKSDQTAAPPAYQPCSPVQGCDGRWYVARDFSDRLSATHLDYEREQGNLQEVERVREIHSEDEIQPGDLVCFGDRVTIWRLVQDVGTPLIPEKAPRKRKKE